MKLNVREGLSASHVSPELLICLEIKCVPVESLKWIYVSASK